MGGMAILVPKIFMTFSILSLVSLALLGISGFVAELIVFFGIITCHTNFLIPKILITFVLAIGMILTPIYSLSMLCQMFYGYKFFNAPNSYFYLYRGYYFFLNKKYWGNNLFFGIQFLRGMPNL